MKTLLRTLACGAISLSALAAGAAEYPNRPIRFVVPYAPGGTTDILARILGPKLTQAWRQQIVVDNRGGANGNIGSDIVAKAAPDGYTILLGTSGSNAVNPSVYARMPYDARRDLALIAMVASTANILVANPRFSGNTIQDVLAMAKKDPGKVTYGSSGVGSVLHLSGELLKTIAGVNMTHVPYKGTGPSLVDLMGGQIDVVFANLPAVVPMVQTGRLKGIAVTTAKRAAALPQIPTMAEGGVRGYDVSSWFAVFVPARTPKPIVNKINAEVEKILKTPETQARLVELGAEPMFMTPEEGNRYFHAEIGKWAKVVKAAGVKPQ
jgi:tripartite-type tricarboxylate transporter receptor subunit TctC